MVLVNGIGGSSIFVLFIVELLKWNSNQIDDDIHVNKY